MSTADDLRAALALIDTPTKWLKKSMAKSAGWREVPPESSEACYFCLLGAIVRATEANVSILASPRQQSARNVLRKVVGLGSAGTSFRPLSEWNDAPERTHEDIVEAFNMAISYAEENDL